MDRVGKIIIMSSDAFMSRLISLWSGVTFTFNFFLTLAIDFFFKSDYTAQ
jgi:hypothetical protein